MPSKPSGHTIARSKRASVLFNLAWFGSLAYFLARGHISPVWDRVYFAFIFVIFPLTFVSVLLVMISARQDARRSQNPDSDVAEVVDGECEFDEGERRKAARLPAPLQDGVTGAGGTRNAANLHEA